MVMGEFSIQILTEITAVFLLEAPGLTRKVPLFDPACFKMDDASSRDTRL